MFAIQALFGMGNPTLQKISTNVWVSFSDRNGFKYAYVCMSQQRLDPISLNHIKNSNFFTLGEGLLSITGLCLSTSQLLLCSLALLGTGREGGMGHSGFMHTLLLSEWRLPKVQ